MTTKLTVHEGKKQPRENDAAALEGEGKLQRVMQIVDESRCYAVRSAIKTLVLSRGIDSTTAFVQDVLATLGK